MDLRLFEVFAHAVQAPNLAAQGQEKPQLQRAGVALPATEGAGESRFEVHLERVEPRRPVGFQAFGVLRVGELAVLHGELALAIALDVEENFQAGLAIAQVIRRDLLGVALRMTSFACLSQRPRRLLSC